MTHGVRDPHGTLALYRDAVHRTSTATDQFSFENGTGSVLVRGYNEPMSPFGQKSLQTRSARNGP